MLSRNTAGVDMFGFATARMLYYSKSMHGFFYDITTDNVYYCKDRQSPIASNFVTNYLETQISSNFSNIIRFIFKSRVFNNGFLCCNSINPKNNLIFLDKYDVNKHNIEKELVLSHVLENHTLNKDIEKRNDNINKESDSKEDDSKSIVCQYGDTWQYIVESGEAGMVKIPVLDELLRLIALVEETDDVYFNPMAESIDIGMLGMKLGIKPFGLLIKKYFSHEKAARIAFASTLTVDNSLFSFLSGIRPAALSRLEEECMVHNIYDTPGSSKGYPFFLYLSTLTGSGDIIDLFFQNNFAYLAHPNHNGDKSMSLMKIMGLLVGCGKYELVVKIVSNKKVLDHFTTDDILDSLLYLIQPGEFKFELKKLANTRETDDNKDNVDKMAMDKIESFLRDFTNEEDNKPTAKIKLFGYMISQIPLLSRLVSTVTDQALGYQTQRKLEAFLSALFGACSSMGTFSRKLMLEKYNGFNDSIWYKQQIHNIFRQLCQTLIILLYFGTLYQTEITRMYEETYEIDGLDTDNFAIMQAFINSVNQANMSHVKRQSISPRYNSYIYHAFQSNHCQFDNRISNFEDFYLNIMSQIEKL